MRWVTGWCARSAPQALNALWRSLSTGWLGEDFEARRPAQFEAGGFPAGQRASRATSRRPGGTADEVAAQFLLGRLDATIDELLAACGSLAHCSYGDLDPVRVHHPLSRAIPLLSGLLDMPTRQLPGDSHMPRVQDGAFGASERFAVSPGRESRRLSATARRTVGPSPVAVLSHGIRGLGGRKADALPAGPGGA